MKPDLSRHPQYKARADHGAGFDNFFIPLHPLSQALAAATSTRQAVEALAAALLEAEKAETCRIALLSPDGVKFREIHEFGFPAAAAEPVEMSLDDAQPLSNAIRWKEPIFPEAPGTEATLPMIGVAALGAVSLGFSEPQDFGSAQRLFLILAAQMAALSIERTQVLDRAGGLRAEAEEMETMFHQIVTAQEEERRRISRELHDASGQYLTVLALGLRALRDETLPDTEAQRALQRMERLVEEMGREINHLAVRLRPAALDDLGLSEALLNYLDEWNEHAGMAVDFHSHGLDSIRLPPHLETIIYRVVQEALNNVLKHAQATHVSLIVEYSPQSVQAIIEDNGRGFDADAPKMLPAQERRLGLMGMKERAAAAGGTCTIESSSGGGTTVFLRLPLGDAAPGREKGN